MPNVIKKTYDLPDFLKTYVKFHHKVLNLGSSDNCNPGWLNVDIQRKPGVNIIADAHYMPMIASESFDVVICCAMLQYCYGPKMVAGEIHRVLKKDGVVYVDVPFVQPFCNDTPDLYRFTLPGLKRIFEGFEVMEAGVSIPASSAILFHLSEVSDNPYVRTLLKCALWPLKWVTFGGRPEVAGGLYLIGRKR